MPGWEVQERGAPSLTDPPELRGQVFVDSTCPAADVSMDSGQALDPALESKGGVGPLGRWGTAQASGGCGPLSVKDGQAQA